MNLLPRDHQEFRQKEYWDTFFKNRGKKAFEWYGEYHELCGILHKYMKSGDPVLQIGCGNSTLAADLYDVGYMQITSIDVSDVVIRQMKEQNKERPGLVFEKMDATAMCYPENTFKVVLDKGTLDALFTDDSPEVASKIEKMFSEIERVLKLGGRYMCVSLLQPHIISHVSRWFASAGWPVRVIRCTEADTCKQPQDRIFPVFVIVCTKFKKMAQMSPVLELSLSTDGQLMRLQQVDSLIDSVRGCQQFAALRARLAKGADSTIEEACLQLHAEDSAATVKYSLYLTERGQMSSNLPFAAFIVPQGREVEWLFAQVEGRRQLCDSADCQRLVVVHLGRETTHTSISEIQQELSSHVMELAPSDLPSGYKIPFLSVGGDDVGTRTIRCRGKSLLSGEYVVEDVQAGDARYRRLIFLDQPNIIQTEATLSTKRDKKKGKTHLVDTTNLVSTYHRLMVGALGQYLDRPVRVLAIGLGGGALSTFIHRTMPLSSLTVVELDQTIVDIAKQQFQFKTDSRLILAVQDGLQFLLENKEKFDVIMLDVDSKDLSQGQSCPPAAFVEPSMLKQIASSLESDGTFVVNLVCRNKQLASALMCELRQVWRCVASCKIAEEVSEIIFATNNPTVSVDQLKKHIISGFKLINDHVKKSIKSKDDLIEIEEILKLVSIKK